MGTEIREDVGGSRTDGVADAGGDAGTAVTTGVDEGRATAVWRDSAVQVVSSMHNPNRMNLRMVINDSCLFKEAVARRDVGF